jgi:hypothetical protein
LKENKNVIKVEYLPKGSPEFNAVKECWREGKDDLLVSRYSPKFQNLKKNIAEYYRTKRFRLNITNYLLRVELRNYVRQYNQLCKSTAKIN